MSIHRDSENVNQVPSVWASISPMRQFPEGDTTESDSVTGSGVYCLRYTTELSGSTYLTAHDGGRRTDKRGFEARILLMCPYAMLITPVR